MRPQHRAHKQRIVLHAVGRARLNAFELVELLLSDFAGGDGLRAVFCQILARADVVVEAVDLLPCAGGEAAIGEQEVEDHVVSS